MVSCSLVVPRLADRRCQLLSGISKLYGGGTHLILIRETCISKLHQSKAII
eukprot:SAG31_NODE_447_length_15579_cov_5.713871_15_plen_51_part_00